MINETRSSGVLLHPTSLPSPFGIGDLGPAAYEFVDFLVVAGQSLWQVLPLGPTGYGDSPYACYSAFAGNTLLINPEQLVKEGLLDAAPPSPVKTYKIDFGEAHKIKQQLLQKEVTMMKYAFRLSIRRSTYVIKCNQRVLVALL